MKCLEVRVHTSQSTSLCWGWRHETMQTDDHRRCFRRYGTTWRRKRRIKRQKTSFYICPVAEVTQRHLPKQTKLRRVNASSEANYHLLSHADCAHGRSSGSKKLTTEINDGNDRTVALLCVLKCHCISVMSCVVIIIIIIIYSFIDKFSKQLKQNANVKSRKCNMIFNDAVSNITGSAVALHCCKAHEKSIGKWEIRPPVKS